jgi:DNA-binding response OmpR family regulator
MEAGLHSHFRSKMKNDVKILLAEDDVNLGFVIRDNLEQHGFTVDLCKNGQEAYSHFLENKYQVCILDVMMPKMDGFELATQIREQNTGIPILFLTAKTLKEDRLRGFMVGGDDYITKPFSIEELICRINVFLKRTGAALTNIVQKIPLGNSTFDHGNLMIISGGEEIKLTQMEADILLYLHEKKGDILKRTEILNRIWGDDDYFNGRSLDVFISRLRKLLAAEPKVSIMNIHGVGFKLKITN